MYNSSYHHGQTLPSLPLQQQYFNTPTYHHSSAPPFISPQSPITTKFYIPTQQQQQHQYYHQTYNQRRLKNNLHYSQSCNQNNQQLHHRHNSQTYHGKSRTLSDTTTLTGSVNSNKLIGTSHKPIKKLSIVGKLKSTADWVVKTFCFCFTDDSLDIIDTHSPLINMNNKNE